jgi:hypothetical protein
MEADWIVSMLYNDYYKYLVWEDTYRRSSPDAFKTVSDLSNDHHNKKKIMHVLHDYKRAVDTYFVNRSYPILLITGLAHPDPVNQPINWVYDNFLAYLRNRGFQTLQLAHTNPYREINAASDMKALIESEIFIGDQASTYARNVARIRTPRGLKSVLPFCSSTRDACNPNR